MKQTPDNVYLTRLKCGIRNWLIHINAKTSVPQLNKLVTFVSTPENVLAFMQCNETKSDFGKISFLKILSLRICLRFIEAYECTNKPRNLRLKNLAENLFFFARVYQDNQSLFGRDSEPTLSSSGQWQSGVDI